MAVDKEANSLSRVYSYYSKFPQIMSICFHLRPYLATSDIFTSSVSVLARMIIIFCPSSLFAIQFSVECFCFGHS